MITLINGKSRKYLAVLCMVMIMVSMFMCTTISAYADGEAAAGSGDLSELTTPINQGLEKVFNAVRLVATAIAIVVAGFTGVKMLLGDARAMETGKATIFKIIAAIAIIWLAPLLVKTIIGLFKNVGSEWNGAINAAG